MAHIELRRVIWGGTIPCRIELDPEESHLVDGASPCFISLPRLSYIPLYLAQICQFFEPSPAGTDALRPEIAWLEFEGVPLKWHWPVGVLYDLFTGRDPTNSQDDENEEYRLPWNLILHFRNFPTKHLMRLDVPSACQDAWINCVKEAACVRHGNSKTVMSLSKAESTKLWEGLAEHDFDKFWSVNGKLVSDASLPLRSFPIRVYIPSVPRVVQLPVPPLLASGEPQTVGTALNSLVPELFKSKRAALVARPVVHGVVVAMNTPLAELVQVAVYSDGFLHITLAMMS